MGNPRLSSKVAQVSIPFACTVLSNGGTWSLSIPLGMKEGQPSILLNTDSISDYLGILKGSVVTNQNFDCDTDTRFSMTISDTITILNTKTLQKRYQNNTTKKEGVLAKVTELVLSDFMGLQITNNP